MSQQIRVRFAPSPTGYIHLGNVRAALLNYIFAQQKNGLLILRIEDTDEQRHVEDAAQALIQDLAWLGITFDEGPHVGGDFQPYRQSDRGPDYQEKLKELIGMGKVYPCFCTADELQRAREEQLARGLPPRYSRKCQKLTREEREELTEQTLQHIWRFAVDSETVVEINDMARGTVTFEMKHFTDFALTRSDGTFTFAFTNFVDDWLMHISHVIRGEDHLTNSAMQAALYDAFDLTYPIFWHLPMLCNAEGKKMSKRDFGFALHELKSSGYLPQAIVNYLAIIGGGTFQSELMSLDQLISAYDFASVHATGQIKYDVEKLTWFNQQWLKTMDNRELAQRVRPYLDKVFDNAAGVGDDVLAQLIGGVKTELHKLSDITQLLNFYFHPPQRSEHVIIEHVGSEVGRKVLTIIKEYRDRTTQSAQFIKLIKEHAKQAGLKLRDLLGTVRYLITGSFQGIGINDLVGMMSDEEFFKRL